MNKPKVLDNTICRYTTGEPCEHRVKLHGNLKAWCKSHQGTMDVIGKTSVRYYKCLEGRRPWVPWLKND